MDAGDIASVAEVGKLLLNAERREREAKRKLAAAQRFIDWAVERAEEERDHAQGQTRSFLVALAEDGRKLRGKR